MKKILPGLLPLLVLVYSPVNVAAEKGPFHYSDNDVSMRLIIRTSEQLAAFYHGREFKQAAIDKITETCFIAAIIKNKQVEVLWLELDNWQFSIDARPIKRLNRDDWKQRWQQVGLPQAHQSTFGWTLLPETRDLRIDESVGGNFALPMQSQAFTLTASFRTGEDKQGTPKTIVFDGVRCLSGKVEVSNK